jgi:hypothetical protein
VNTWGAKRKLLSRGASMPGQQYYLLLADRNSTTKVLTERTAASKTAKALLWYKSIISQNLAYRFSSLFKQYLRTNIRTETNNRKIKPSLHTAQYERTLGLPIRLLMLYQPRYPVGLYCIFDNM